MLSDEVGEQLVRLRKAAGLTREQLAAECAAAGSPALTAAALGNIETGRRDPTGRRRREITVDELVVLAYVLDVPPVALLLPVGSEASVQVLPTQQRSTADALAWVRGDRPLVGRREPAAYLALRLYVQADEQAHRLLDLLSEWGPEQPPDDDPSVRGAEAVQDRPPGWHERFEGTIERLRGYRRQLHALGHPRPSLPPGLEWVDSERGDT